MNETNPTGPRIEVMWRPGCPFCSSLRRGLSRVGVATIEHDIWPSAHAAARVREATGGDETLPTVFVGARALVNPSVRQVLVAIRYADGWRVLSPKGEELGANTLGHDHASEQPFTRSQSGLRIPSDIAEVTVEGHDLKNGYGGRTVTVDVPS